MGNAIWEIGLVLEICPNPKPCFLWWFRQRFAQRRVPNLNAYYLYDVLSCAAPNPMRVV